MVNECRLCSSKLGPQFTKGKIFGEEVSYYQCFTCGFVQTEYPYWLEKAYISAINNCDTGIMLRNQENVNIVLATLHLLNSKGGKLIDYAGGYGILVRMLRDIGVDALWSDPYCSNLLAQGFERNRNDSAILITAFEAFEHFIYPLKEMDEMFKTSPNLLISTLLIPSPLPMSNEWWYYGLNHGQHIGFFNERSLQYLASKFNKHLLTDGQNYHLFTDKKLSNFKWKIYKKIGKLIPTHFRRNYTSKVWTDFISMSN